MEKELIYVEWEDAESRADWLTEKEVMEWAEGSRCVIREIGWVMMDTDELLVISNQRQLGMTKGTEETFGNTTRIPKTWIRHRQTLKIESPTFVAGRESIGPNMGKIRDAIGKSWRG